MSGSRTTAIAIDGPVGAGKTAAGKQLAERLGYRFLDTGQMYRAATLIALRSGTDFSDGPAMVSLVKGLSFELVPAGGADVRIVVNGEDVTDHLRSPEIDRVISLLSAVEGVREIMVAAQRRIAEGGKVVMAGRDIGTVVLPDAQRKVFLTAPPEVRARRRHLEMKQGGGRLSYAEILESMRNRDRLDSTRATSPLRPADDARVIDTGDMTLDEVVDAIVDFAGEAA